MQSLRDENYKDCYAKLKQAEIILSRAPDEY